MPSLLLTAALSFSIFIAGVMALVRFKDINKIYHPFLFCIWAACLNEVISAICLQYSYDDSLSNNIYMLCESILIVFQFKNLGIMCKPKYISKIAALALLLIWTIDNFLIGNIFILNILFSLIYSSAIVILSLECINRLIVNNTKLVKNATFCLCVGFIFYFTFNILTLTFWLNKLHIKKSFLLRIDELVIYVNLITNLVYALAVLWMPKKIAFLLPY